MAFASHVREWDRSVWRRQTLGINRVRHARLIYLGLVDPSQVLIVVCEDNLNAQRDEVCLVGGQTIARASSLRQHNRHNNEDDSKEDGNDDRRNPTALSFLGVDEHCFQFLTPQFSLSQ